MTDTPLKAASLLVFFIIFSVSAHVHAEIDKKSLIIYKKRCSWCHGMTGRGDGPASKFISPPPRNFTLGLNKFVSSVPGEITLPTDRDIFRAISNGLPGTAMKAWKRVFSESEIEGLVQVVKGFTDIYSFEKKPETLPMPEKIPPSPDSVRKGRFLFRSAGCFECHGEEGRGDGSKLLREKSGARVWPRNLTKPWTFKGGNAPEDIFRRVSAGIPGTPMPAFGLERRADDLVKGRTLSTEERWHLVNFVLSLKDRRYKNVGSIIRARHLDGGSLPGGINDKRWRRVPWTSLYLSPNLVAKNRLFNPLNDIIRVKALFNDNSLALLMAWSDRTKSLPLGKNLENLGGEKIYEDSVAAQFPAHTGSGMKHAYLGHGSGGEGNVTVWQWRSGTMESPQTAALYSGRGYKTTLRRQTAPSPLYSKGVYENGEWIVLVKEAEPVLSKKAVYEAGKYVPVAFASWDGSNGESGSRHTFTRWGAIYLTPPENFFRLLTPAAVFIILFSIQFGIHKRVSLNIGRI